LIIAQVAMVPAMASKTTRKSAEERDVDAGGACAEEVQKA